MTLKKTIAVALVCAASASASSAATFTATVQGTDNIYFTDWGSSNNGTNRDTTGGGTQPTAVSDGTGAVNFAGLGPLTTVATGLVFDDGSASTGPDGQAALFNGLPVYALIGVFSSTSNVITAIGDSFFVGASNTIAVPVSTSAYLFMGDNDGGHGDNSGSYSVTITTSSVPLPASAPMLAAGLIGVGARVRRKQGRRMGAPQARSARGCAARKVGAWVRRKRRTQA